HPEGARGHHEVALAQGEGLRADDARVDGPARRAQHHDHVGHAGAEHGDDGESEQHEGKGEHHVDQGHDAPVDTAGEVARGQTEEDADGGGEEHGRYAHHQGDAPAPDHPREEIASDLIRAEEMLAGAAVHPCGRRHAVADGHAEGIVGRDPGRADRAQPDEDKHDGPSHSPLEPAEPPPRRAGSLGGGRRLEACGNDGGTRPDGHQAPARMRGSISPTRRSTRALTTTMTRASSTTAHWTTGKSWLRIESTVRVATPGHAKTVSVTKAPPRSWPNCSPSTVTTGMHALRKACFTTTIRSTRPLARAVLMNSMFMT